LDFNNSLKPSDFFSFFFVLSFIDYLPSSPLHFLSFFPFDPALVLLFKP
jgi:hypothetical protein